jgi:hypothetical protein
MVQVTPYESLPSMMLDSHRGGGSWDVVPSQTDCMPPFLLIRHFFSILLFLYSSSFLIIRLLAIMTHQTVGGVSDAINLKGQMTASIKMSDEIWNPDAELTL